MVSIVREVSQPTPAKVLIVGAGPTGLTAAAFFARQNVDFDLIDTRSAPVDESRALGVHARSLEFMSMLGLDEAFIEQGHPTRYMTFHRGEKKLFKFDFGVLANETRYPYMLVLPQSRSERILAEHLKQVGARIGWQSKLRSFSQDDEGVSAEIEDADGQITRRRYSYLIGCDGAASLVRNTLGISFEGETYPLQFLLSEVKIDRNAIDRSSSHVFMGKETTVAVIPQPDDVYRIVGPDFSVGKQSEEIAGKRELEFNDFDRFLIRNDLLQHVRLQNPSRLVSYRIHKRVAARYRQGRVFIAGDAAHIHSPAGGQGMNTGLNDVANLTWKIAAVLQGNADVSLLDSYEDERRPAALSIVTNADAAMMKVVSRSLGARFLFDYIAPLVTRYYQPYRLLATMAQLSWHYPQLKAGPGKAGASDPAVGARLADYPLRGGGRANQRLGISQYVAFRSGDGTRTDTVDHPLVPSYARPGRGIASFAQPVTVGPAKKPFSGIVLVRPDGYVAATYASESELDSTPVPQNFPHVSRL
jgi:2-polyprenyl-6-methoxyphenol hydroxylase-like FAD-dependent oxidoreductase